MSFTFKEKLAEDNVLGTMVSELAAPNIARILAACGFDFIIIDCEHGPFDYSQASGVVGVARGAGLPAIIRLPNADREHITKYMDMGAAGLLLPMTADGAHIREVVRYAKYAPLGERGISTQRAHTDYAPPPLKEYMEQANRSTVIFAQIETREAIGNIDGILAVEGVDGVFVGPNDLACDYGAPGVLDDPDMEHGIRQILAACKRFGKPCGIISGKMPLLEKWRGEGMTVFSCNSEVGMIIDAGKKVVSSFRQL